MSGQIRKHTLNNNDALDYRRVQELFLEAAKRFSEIPGLALGDNQFRRADFLLDAWQEYYGVFATGTSFKLPTHGYIVSNCLLEVKHDDGYFEGEVGWSLDVEAKSQESLGPSGVGKMIMGWPVVDGQAIWGGEDSIMPDKLISYPAPVDTDPALTHDDEIAGSDLTAFPFLTLGSKATVNGLNGRSHVGIMTFSIGNFTVLKSAMSVRKVLR